MKGWLIIGALLYVLTASTQAVPADTIISGVKVGYQYSPINFPESWLEEPIHASGKQIHPEEIRRHTDIIIRALQKYPPALLKANLHSIYLLHSMRFYDVEYGGTNSTFDLFLCNEGDDAGYNDFYLEQTIHHEFSSILYRNFESYFNEKEWLSANADNFTYNDPEQGVGAIRNNESSQVSDEELCTKGFLTQYALSSMENDLNTIAQNLFCPGDNFWRIVRTYPRIQKKVTILIQFYKKINPVFTEKYFQSLSKQ
jgi:putative zinc-binding metallo-peptidase